MDKKQIVFIGIGIIILVLFSFIFVRLLPKKEKMFFTTEPETWIETENQDKIINVRKASLDKTIVQGNKLEYLTESGIIPFFTYGYFKGYHFTEKMTGTIFGTQTNDMMRITNLMNPNDGIIEGYIVAREEEGSFVFYLFVDEDWKKQMEYTNILYTDDFKGQINVRRFDFSDNFEGIYIDKIEDASWYLKDPRVGGLMVGEVDEDTPKKAPSEIKSTFIYMR